MTTYRNLQVYLTKYKYFVKRIQIETVVVNSVKRIFITKYEYLQDPMSAAEEP